MLVELVPVPIVLAGVSVAVYTDLEENRIRNKLTLPMIGLGMLFYMVAGFLRDSVSPYLGVLGAGAGFFLSYPLYLAGAFGDGDVKLLAGIGALLPVIPPSVVHFGVPLFDTLPLFPLTVLVNGLLVSSPPIAGYSLACFVRGEGLSCKEVPLSELEEGMISEEAVWETDWGVWRKDDLPEDYDRCYADPSDQEGLDKDQVEGLLRLRAEGKFEGPLKVKRTFPFGPVIAVGVFTGVFLGNLYWMALGLI